MQGGGEKACVGPKAADTQAKTREQHEGLAAKVRSAQPKSVFVCFVSWW